MRRCVRPLPVRVGSGRMPEQIDVIRYYVFF